MAWTTLQNVYDHVRWKTKLNSTNLADADLLRTSNMKFRRIIQKLVDLKEGWHGEISTFNLVANQNEYTFPADAAGSPFGGGLIHILRLEVTYDGTTWIRVNPLNQAVVKKPIGTDALVDEEFTTGEPYYYVHDNSFFLLPASASDRTNGGRIWWVKRPGEMTAGTAVPEFPNELLEALEMAIEADVLARAKEYAGADRLDAKLTEAGFPPVSAEDIAGRFEDEQPQLKSNVPNYK